MVSCISADHGRVSLPFLEAGIPTFVDQPFAVTRADLDRLCAAGRPGTPLLSCSALRYPRDYVLLREGIAAGRLGVLLGGTATVCHPITAYLRPGNTWQDEIERGGGSIVNMGIHGLEPLVALLDPGLASVYCVSAKRVLPESRSEDMATIALQWRDGKTATVQVVCGAATHGYGVAVYAARGRAVGCKARGGRRRAVGGIRGWHRALHSAISGVSPPSVAPGFHPDRSPALPRSRHSVRPLPAPRRVRCW